MGEETGWERERERVCVKDEWQSLFEYIVHILYFHFSINIYSRLGCGILGSDWGKRFCNSNMSIIKFGKVITLAVWKQGKN